jgi:hypothetical protein
VQQPAWRTFRYPTIGVDFHLRTAYVELLDDELYPDRHWLR